jgi:hypothetical protein
VVRVCGNREYGSGKSRSEDVCPVCGEDMTKAYYAGKKHICKGIGEVGYQPWFVDDELDENGEPNYVDVVGSRDEGGKR